jgi:lipopolysaccharide transport protein LptA
VQTRGGASARPWPSPPLPRVDTATLVMLAAALAVLLNAALTRAALAQTGLATAGESSPGGGDSAGGTVTAPIEAPPPTGEVTAPDVTATPGATAPEVSKATVRSARHADTSRPNGQPSSPFGAFDSSNQNRGPINIQSDSLTLDYKKNTTLFSGHVHATQADGELTSRTLEVQHGKDFHEAQQLIASGDVRISQGTRWCTADHAVMNQGVHTVVLTGSPVCHDANDQIAGSKITVYMQTGLSVVDEAKAVIFPRQSKTRDNEATADHAKQLGD